jgi:hypothetical protein
VGTYVGLAFIMLCIAWTLVRGGDSYILLRIAMGLALVVVAGFLTFLAVWSWKERNIPLTVERFGSIRYGDMELCPTIMVRAVRIVHARGGEPDDCVVCLELDEGKKLVLPGRHFADFHSREHARPFAAALASALGVPLRDSEIPTR